MISHPLKRSLLLMVVTVLVAVGCGRSETPDPPQPSLKGVEPVVADAVEAARRAVLDAPESAQAWGRLGDRFAAHRWDLEAAECYAQAERLQSHAFVWAYMQAHALARSDLIGSSEAFARAVTLDERYPQAHYFYAHSLQRLGRLDEARAQYERATELDPSLSHAWLALGLLALEQGRVEDGRAHLEHALQIESRHYEAHHALAQVYLALNDEQRARRHAGLASASSDDSPRVPDPRRQRQVEPVGVIANNRRGLQLLEEGRLDQAAYHFEQALKSNPERPAVHYNLGRVRQQQGRLDEAIAHYGEALRINPDYTEAHHALGTSLSMAGRQAEAIPHLERTLEKWPDYAPAHINLGTALLRQSRLDAAIRHFRRAVEIRPDDVAANYNLGSALAKQGKLSEAKIYIRRAAELAPD